VVLNPLSAYIPELLAVDVMLHLFVDVYCWQWLDSYFDRAKIDASLNDASREFFIRAMGRFASIVLREVEWPKQLDMCD